MKINSGVTKSFPKPNSIVESCPSARQLLEEHLGIGSDYPVAPIDWLYDDILSPGRQTKKEIDIATLKDLLNDKEIDRSKVIMILYGLGEITYSSDLEPNKALDITVKNLKTLKENNDTGYRLAVDYLKSLYGTTEQVSYFSEVRTPGRTLDLGKRTAEMAGLEEQSVGHNRSKVIHLDNNEGMCIDNTTDKLERLFNRLNR